MHLLAVPRRYTQQEDDVFQSFSYFEPHTPTRERRRRGLTVIGHLANVAGKFKRLGPARLATLTAALLTVPLWAVFTNGGFETGTPGSAPPSWTVATYLNPGITIQLPQTFSGLNLQTGGNALTTILGPSVPFTQPDPDLGAPASFRWPRYGNQAAIVNQHGFNRNVNSLSQTMTVTAGDQDPVDGKVHIRFAFAPVVQLPPTGHASYQVPYYFIQVTNLTKANLVLYQEFGAAGAGDIWKVINSGQTNQLFYTDWQLVDIAPGPSDISMNDQIKLEILAAGCSLSGHWGEVYVDGVGPTIPGISVEGTAPAYANPGANITYDLTYRNGGSSSATNVVLSFTTPTDTTYQSMSGSGVNGVRNSGLYNPFADMNGDGVVDAADVNIVRTRLGTSLP
jgi:uncharacterized repeat protein (TIGR01451 family)